MLEWVPKRTSADVMTPTPGASPMADETAVAAAPTPASPVRKVTERMRTAALLLAGLMGVALYLTITFPTEAVLGDKVKLPIFHGAFTWANLVVFSLLGVFAIAYVAVHKRGGSAADRVYGWERGLRWVGSGMWLAGTVMGFIAALQTWDFSASQTSPYEAVLADPRLMAQIYVAVAVAVLLILDWILDERWHKALSDGMFMVVMWALLINVFVNPEAQALHPDSPVLNSAMDIQWRFFTIFGALVGSALVLAYILRVAYTVKRSKLAAG